MAQYKEEGIDILRLFGEDSIIYYYDPSSMWRMTFDFKKRYDEIKGRPDKLLSDSNLEAQRSLLRIKN